MNCIAFIFRITIQSVKVVAAILCDYVISPGKHRVSVGSTVCWTRLWSPVCSGDLCGGIAICQTAWINFSGRLYHCSLVIGFVPSPPPPKMIGGKRQELPVCYYIAFFLFV